MLLDLREVLVTPDAVAKFSFPLDLSQYELHDEKPIVNPVAVEGTVRNHAGALVLEGMMATTLQLRCDRCLEVIQREKTVPLQSLLADHLEDEENDEIILLTGTSLNLEEVASTTFLLEMDTKSLCSEQCLGLCPGCGVNLNEEDCGCKPENDSPFAKLAQLLED